MRALPCTNSVRRKGSRGNRLRRVSDLSRQCYLHLTGLLFYESILVYPSIYADNRCCVALPFFVAAVSLQGLGGIGAFFRVGFWGALPAELKGLEFVYRVPLMTHVSDFQNRVLKLIHPLVSDPSKVRFFLFLLCVFTSIERVDRFICVHSKPL